MENSIICLRRDSSSYLKMKSEKYKKPKNKWEPSVSAKKVSLKDIYKIIKSYFS